MSDNDLIRRGDAMAEIELYRRDWSDARNAIAALAASQSPDPVTNADSQQPEGA